MADRPLIIELLLGVQETTNHRIRKFGYGDGYEQIAADGINTKVREYNITTIPFSRFEMNAFKEQLDDVCVGDFFLVPAFPGLPPYIVGEEIRFRLVDNNYTLTFFPAAEKFQFTFTLKEAFSG